MSIVSVSRRAGGRTAGTPRGRIRRPARAGNRRGPRTPPRGAAGPADPRRQQARCRTYRSRSPESASPSTAAARCPSPSAGNHRARGDAAPLGRPGHPVQRLLGGQPRELAGSDHGAGINIGLLHRLGRQRTPAASRPGWDHDPDRQACTSWRTRSRAGRARARPSRRRSRNRPARSSPPRRAPPRR